MSEFIGGAYRALPSRRVYIPKPDGRQRPLAVAALEDKTVQGATAAVHAEGQPRPPKRSVSTYRRSCWPAPNLHFGSLSARIPSLWISGVLANRSPASAFSISAAATLPLRCASRPASSSNVSKMANDDRPSRMANHEIVPTSAFTEGTAERKKIRDLLLLAQLRLQRNIQCKFCHHILLS